MAGRLDELGEREDAVRLYIRGEEIKSYSQYAVTASVFQQPAAFRMTLGWGHSIRMLRERYKKRDPFELKIANSVVQSGKIDGFTTHVSGSGSTIDVEGRDILAPLYDSFVPAERSFSQATYTDLLYEVLSLLGYPDIIIFTDNDANRYAISGGKLKPRKRSTAFNVITEQTYLATWESKTTLVLNTIKAKLGERWLQFLQKEFKKAGLFLWATVDGGIVLSSPSGDQPPSAKILHRRNTTRAGSNVLDASFKDNTVGRYTRAVVHGRTGGGKFGRKKISAEYIDQEMAELYDGNLEAKQLVIHETDADSVAACRFVAERAIAEANRGEIELTYEVAGHTTVGLNGEDRVVWTPDTVVEVEDHEQGVFGLWYLAEVTYQRSSRTTTRLKLMRPQDLVFGELSKKKKGK